jgi:hypothetical protein
MFILYAIAIAVIGMRVPLMIDPYYHHEKVPPFVWLAREIEETWTGERE